jgi:hypothetical protein
MTTLSDTLTVGLVLVLLFGSIALYLYTRVQQSEQKLSLLEGILLDLKMSSEVNSYTELPAENHETYVPYEEIPVEKELEPEVEQYKSVDNPIELEAPKYESMTLKELQSLAKSRDITVGSMKKGQLIDALKAGDISYQSSSEPTSFLETSASIDV